MSSYVLGKYADKDGTTDFFKFSEFGYTDLQIERINDPEGGEKTEMPTAVPSPFARFDLVQTAFKNISKNPQLVAQKGKDIKASKFDERLVSHTLDLAEYVFNSQARGGKLDILTWNREGEDSHLKKLKNGTKEHKDFAASLELYLNQDAEVYNFGKMKKIFLFKYGVNIIGSTSPVTLFCPSAANLSKLDIRRMADRSLAFGEDFLPLYNRTFEFQEWFFCLLAVCRNLDSECIKNLDCVYEYARLSLKELEQLNNSKANDFEKIFKSTLSPGDFKNKYSPLNDKKGDNSPVDILGIELCVGKKEAIKNSLQDSDFLIKPTKEYGKTQLPLVLQDGFGKSGWNYLRGLQFKTEIKVPSFVDKSWKAERTMPGFSDIEGYYLTISDFLEPYLIRTIYPISDSFYDGGCKADKEHKGYLLPLKRDFFEFFNVEDLIKDGDGKPQFSIGPKDNGDVEVTLKIPVQKGDITFKRIYKQGQPNQLPDQKIPDGGVILEAKFGTTIFPFVKAGEHANVNYRVQLVDADYASQLKNRDYSLEFYTKDNNEIGKSSSKNKHRRSDKNKSSLYTSDYYKVTKEFDIIQFKINDLNGAEALIIPKWPSPYKGGSDKKYTFAVDFGTTNTYVAYKIDGQDAGPFYLKNAIANLFDEKNPDIQKYMTNAGADDIMDFINKEFVPRNIGKENKQDDNIFVFPQRTAIAYNQEMRAEDWDDGDGLDTLLEGNIPFGYEKTNQRGNEIATDLKWSDGNDRIQKQMCAYLEEITMLMQAKVLLENGKLTESRVVWFHPSSMENEQIDFLNVQWEGYFKQYFKDENITKRLISIPESIAPYYAEEHRGFQGGAVASIDIGGGTTDVAVFVPSDMDKKEPTLKATTSFKFAGNALFGDGYSERAANKNGFVLRFAELFEKNLKPYPDALEIFMALRDPKRAKASDINTFMFSVENAISFWAKSTGTEIEESKKTSFSYTKQLQSCTDLKFLILYFYVAIVYHISKILKQIDTQVNYLMFSGTASKILNILSRGNKEKLNRFTRKIFEKLDLESKNLEVILVDDPKEVTCIGGLRAIKDFDDSEKAERMRSNNKNSGLIYTCLKGEGKEFVSRYSEAVKYSDYINNIKSIEKELVDFHEFFFKLNDDSDLNMVDFWTLNEDVVRYVQNNYKNLLDKLLLDNIRRIKPNKDKISETPFFIPLKGIILELSEQIAMKKYSK